MKMFATVPLAAMVVALAACQGREDETREDQAPDIEEAIPVDQPAGDAAGTGTNGTAGEAAALGDDRSATAAIAPEPGIDTMESGSNPPEMTSPPPGSKVQRAD